VVVLRQELGELLRETRVEQGRTLREVAADATIAFGYLSEIERGTKEASSELLVAICGALGLTLSELLADLTERVARAEVLAAPVRLPVRDREAARVSAA
jgi:transcriptional regulator with XRE-family HTH domain